MNSLLLGGSGFIGSELGRAMVRRGENVVSVSLDGQGNAPGVTPVALDLYDQDCPKRFIRDADAVFILVGQVHSEFNADKEKRLITRLAKALQHSPAHVFYCSTVHVYGNASEPVNESSPLTPLDAYGQFKVEAEALLKTLIPAERFTLFRLTNIYGGPKNRGLIGILMKKLVAEDEPTIKLNGDGQQRRDYLFLDDLVAAMLTVRDSPNGHGIVNLATGTTLSLIEVVELASKVAGRDIKCEITHASVNEAQDCFVDNTRLKEEFGFTDFTSLEEGLTKTLERYKEN